MELNVMRQALRQCCTLNDMDDGQMGLLVMAAHAKTFGPGETIYRKGEEAEGNFSLIASGKVQVYAKTGLVLKELGPGELIGEVGTISKQGVRTVTVKALESTELVEWNIEDIERHSPELVKKLKDLAWKRLKSWSE